VRFPYTMLTLQPVSSHFSSRGVGGGGVGANPLVELTVNSKEEILKTFVPITSKNSVSVLPCVHKDVFQLSNTFRKVLKSIQ
jgi:hypothetical protein